MGQVLHHTESSYLGKVLYHHHCGCMGNATTFACKSQECHWQDWYISIRFCKSIILLVYDLHIIWLVIVDPVPSCSLLEETSKVVNLVGSAVLAQCQNTQQVFNISHTGK